MKFANSEAEYLARQRRATEYQASMAGVMSASFRCATCKQYKRVAGRKRISKHAKDGYMCADCAKGAAA